MIQENQAFTWTGYRKGGKSRDTKMATSQNPGMLNCGMSHPALRLREEGISFLRPNILEM